MGTDDRFDDRSKSRMVPMNNDQVWMFDAVRAMNGRDRGALIAWWLVGLGFLAVAIAGSSAVLAGLSAVFLALALWWTITKVRSARESAAIQRYADSRPDSPE